MKGFIYKVTCTITNKVYIGQTQRDVELRWKEHRRHCYEKVSIIIIVNFIEQ